MNFETTQTCPQYPQNAVVTLPEGNCADIADTSERVRKLFDDLKSLGVVVSIAPDGRLSVDGPELVMTDDLLDRVRADRDDLLAMVERFEERSAIAEHDGGLSRDDAERLARAEVRDDLLTIVSKSQRDDLSPIGDKNEVDDLGTIATKPVLMPEGVYCPYCRGRSFYAVPVGSVCARCRRMAWVTLRSGSICRADRTNDELLDQLSKNARERFFGVADVPDGNIKKITRSTESFDRLSHAQRSAYPNETFAYLDPIEMATPCFRCSNTRSYLSIIHNGESLRRDCARCGRFIEFATWHDRQSTTEAIENLNSVKF